MFKIVASAVALIVLLPATAMAHITFDSREASVGSTWKAVLRVPHGCDGQPTLKVRVKVPEGMFAVKPMPKPGWEVETVTGKYQGGYDNHGTVLTEGVTEIVWTGKLLDEHYDEFVFRGSLADSLPAGEMLYFPVVQECEGGAERWIELPAAGGDAHELAFPAPGIKLLPKK